MGSFENRRVLVVDDEPTLHEDFRNVLGIAGQAGSTEALDRMEASLFDEAAPEPAADFTLSSAFQGIEGAELVRRALGDDQPFSVAFIDMRMPPGWDGLRTVQEIWRLDPRMHVVICTAYADHDWEAALRRLDPGDRLLVIKKPFDPIEVWQAAAMFSAKWQRAREIEARLRDLESAGGGDAGSA